MLKTRSQFFPYNKHSNFRFPDIDQTYHVIGVLEYTNSVIDQLILTATEGVGEVHHGEEPEALREDESHAHEPHGESEHKEEEQEAYKEGKEILGVDEGRPLVVALAIGALVSLFSAIRVFNLNISKTLADA